MNEFINMFSAQMLTLTFAWLFKRFIEPRLNNGHKKLKEKLKK